MYNLLLKYYENNLIGGDNLTNEEIDLLNKAGFDRTVINAINLQDISEDEKENILKEVKFNKYFNENKYRIQDIVTASLLAHRNPSFRDTIIRKYNITNESPVSKLVLILGGSNLDTNYDRYLLPEYYSIVMNSYGEELKTSKTIDLYDQDQLLLTNETGIYGDFNNIDLWRKIPNNTFDLILFDWSTDKFMYCDISLIKEIMRTIKLDGNFWVSSTIGISGIPIEKKDFDILTKQHTKFLTELEYEFDVSYHTSIPFKREVGGKVYGKNSIFLKISHKR